MTTTYVTILSQHAEASKWHARWLAEHSSNGTEATGRTPLEALENLVEVLRVQERGRSTTRPDERRDQVT